MSNRFEPGNRKWQVFGLVGVSIFMSTLDSSIVNVALPYIMDDLSSDVQTIQWVVIIYLLTVSSLLLTFGRLSDIRGRQSVYIAGFMVFTLGSLLCGIAPGPGLLILARAVQGMGASMLMACSPALIVDVFEKEERGRALGMVGAVVAAGLTTGPVAGGLILEYFSWRVIFFLNLPIGIFAVLAGWRILNRISRAKGNQEPLDKVGSLMMICMLGFLITGLARSSDWGFFSFKVGLCMLGALAGFAGFVLNERQSSFPLFDLGLLKIRLFALPLASAAILFASLFVLIFMMPFYLAYPCGFSASRTGMVMIVPFLFLLVVSPVSGAMFNRAGSRLLCTAGMGLLGLSLFFLGFLDPGSGVIPVLWRMALAGIGTALFISPNNTAIMGAVPADRRGTASGAVATARNLGMVFGVAMAGALFSSAFPFQSGGFEGFAPSMIPGFMEGFRRVMAAGTAMAGLGLVVSFLRGREKNKNG
ncbi:MFS transporter [Desulfospira joergensenii]|uniref:MFS transporter n=1 Tax=Desulfospira joergensenii TaxID=53329 RepID=UPI0003B5B7BD|nr:MFS transporter [Desulfospira joergensenii]